MPKHYRYDSLTVEPMETSSGFLRAKVSLAKPGVFEYILSDGKTRKEAKLPEDLFSSVTIDSARNAPITDEHPPLSDNRGLINSKNYSKYTKGVLSDSVLVENNYLNSQEIIFDSSLIEALKRGEKREVSIGFLLG